ncbi:uncharacterized protein LKV04_017540 [Tautogolabrus adspersus]
MSRRRAILRGGTPPPPVNRIRENSRLMRTHETMVDFISGRRPTSSFLDVFTQGFGLDFLRNFDGDLEDDIVYSDDDDDDYYDRSSPHYSPNRTLQPHPRIRQLTEEEAAKHAKELIEEEERCKERTERNKRKKMRKKEKKRLEKENAVKSVIPEEEERKSDSSENQEESPKIETKLMANESCERGESPDEPEAAGCEQRGGGNKEDNLLKINNEEELELKQDLEFKNSNACADKTAPEETPDERPAEEKKIKEKNEELKVQQPSEEEPKVEEQPKVQKIEEKHEPVKEETTDPTAEQSARRSRELAGNGNRLAAHGQYEMAVKYFTDAIKYNPKEFRLFGNRSFCYERMEQYENALRDADLAVCMEPNWIKGLFRKGKALCGLKRYYEASLIYKEVLKLESSSVEARQELKRAQTLHLMEMGFTWAQSSEALKTHATLEEAVEALFCGDNAQSPADASACREITNKPVWHEEEGEEKEEWIVLPTSRPRAQQVKESEAMGLVRSKSQSPTPGLKSPMKPTLFSVWVGSMAPDVTYATLHELFSRAGTVHSIKMLLEQQCAFINYTRREDCERAILCINGMVVEGSPLAVRHPGKFNSGPGSYKKECFFWRTSGCTRQDCTFRHVPENKNIDQAKFTNRLGNFHM